MINILFAHADRRIVDLYSPHLSQHFTTISAFDGLTALRKIRLTNPSLIVSDYQLPLLSGLALLKFVRNHPVLGPVPFMFLCNHISAPSALSLGANDWLDLSATTPELLLKKIFYQLKTTIC